MKNADKPIYPFNEIDWNRSSSEVTTYYSQESGLTKREYFAGLAMQSILSTMDFKKTAPIKEWKEEIYMATKGALTIADKLLEELEKK